jgi:plasmid stabilization system protein ParE
MFKVIVSPQAWEDFVEIFEYIAQDNREAARRFCDALLDHVDLLATFPHLGTVVKGRNVRSILHTPVRVYYRVNETRGCVEVIHFWHSARRMPDL